MEAPIEKTELSLNEQIDNILNRISTLDVSHLSYALSLTDYEQYQEDIEDTIDTLDMLNDMNKYFEDKVLAYPVIILEDMSNTEQVIKGSTEANVIVLTSDLTFLYKYHETELLIPGFKYFTSYFSSLSYDSRLHMLKDAFKRVLESIIKIIEKFKDKSIGLNIDLPERKVESKPEDREPVIIKRRSEVSRLLEDMAPSDKPIIHDNV